METPIVAIIGSPNVGKSTLFNCLTKTSHALVSAYPGTTRDRQFGIIHCNGHDCIVIDTSGIVENSQETLEKLMMRQTQLAITEADQVIFLVDGRTGITTEDQRIANYLRTHNKPVLLAVNKIEGLNPSQWLSEACELGIGRPLAISTAHRQGIDELVALLSPQEHRHSPITEQSSTSSIPKPIKLAIIGCPNSGKSTLINSLLREERVIAHPTAGTTRDSLYIPLKRNHQHYLLIDTAGVRRQKKRKIILEKLSVIKTIQAIQTTDTAIYLIDGIVGITDQDLKLIYFTLDCGAGLVIAVNKWDCLNEVSRRQVQLEIKKRLYGLTTIPLHYISAAQKTGLNALFHAIHQAHLATIVTPTTSQLTSLLQKAVANHTPPLVKGRRIKLRYAHLGHHHPLCIVIHGKQVDALPDSYHRYLANFYQQALQLTGVLIKLIFKTSPNPFAPSQT